MLSNIFLLISGASLLVIFILIIAIIYMYVHSKKYQLIIALCNIAEILIPIFVGFAILGVIYKEY